MTNNAAPNKTLLSKLASQCFAMWHKRRRKMSRTHQTKRGTKLYI